MNELASGIHLGRGGYRNALLKRHEDAGEFTENPWHRMKTSKQLRLEEIEFSNRQAATARCAFCDWSLDATVAECREAFREHREVHR